MVLLCVNVALDHCKNNKEVIDLCRAQVRIKKSVKDVLRLNSTLFMDEALHVHGTYLVLLSTTDTDGNSQHRSTKLLHIDTYRNCQSEPSAEVPDGKEFNSKDSFLLTEVKVPVGQR